MLRQQINLARLAFDNIIRRRGIYLLLAVSVAIGTAVILILFMTASGLQTTAADNLMQLPLNKMWVRPGRSAEATDNRDDILITQELLDLLETQTGVLEVWPQIDYSRTAYVELMINVGFYRENFSNITEVYGVREELIRDELFDGESFDWDGTGTIPVLFPEAVVNMVNNRVSRQALPGGKRFSPDIIGTFNVGVFLGVDRKVSNIGFARQDCKAVGISRTIPQVGIALPLEAVKKFNSQYTTEGGDNLQFSRVLVETENPAQAAQLARQLETDGYTVESSRKTYEQISRIFNGVQAGIAFFGILIAIAVGIGLFNGFNLVIHSEESILGVMRAVGARRRQIMEIILLQAALIGLCGAVLGTLSAWAMAVGLEGYLASILAQYGLNIGAFTPGASVLLAGLLIPAPICLIFGLVPAIRAVSLKPGRILR